MNKVKILSMSDIVILNELNKILEVIPMEEKKVKIDKLDIFLDGIIFASKISEKKAI